MVTRAARTCTLLAQDLYALAERTRLDDSEPMSPLVVQLVATISLCGAIALCCLAMRCWRRHATRKFLAGLPEASDDGTWLVVAFEWGGIEGVQSGRMPLDGIVSAHTTRIPVKQKHHSGSREIDACAHAMRELWWRIPTSELA